MKTCIVFTGHMIDAPGREVPRFPAEKEAAAQLAIRIMIEKLCNDTAACSGIAGGACGGDILFHELCLQMQIPSEMYLPSPPDEFKQESVSFAGKNWEERFDALTQTLPVHVMHPVSAGTDKWEKVNDKMLEVALQENAETIVLIALWNGGDGDGKGGTAHMISIAKKYKARIEIIDPANL